ncbi:hypothetical protein C0Q70_14433 [Pomacea canaliculata]|uniref:Ricin B lectin domain-containing protein n=2 Tax=Pomacea canaliculata TaxID=400727 RepID=A0A2T7P024_POMCA|nr:hypothetical protein C0Q70_14433 [Pomacea canaliculata]
MFVRKKDSTSDGVSMHSVASDLWRYEENTKRLRHVTSDLCLQKKANEPQRLVLRTCSTSDLQRWTFQRRQPLTFL